MKEISFFCVAVYWSIVSLNWWKILSNIYDRVVFSSKLTAWSYVRTLLCKCKNFLHRGTEELEYIMIFVLSLLYTVFHSCTLLLTFCFKNFCKVNYFYSTILLTLKKNISSSRKAIGKWFIIYAQCTILSLVFYFSFDCWWSLAQ